MIRILRREQSPPGSQTRMSIDEKFRVPRRRAAIVAVGETSEALLLRGILESLGAVVTLHQPATPEDFLLVLGQGAAAPRHIVISAHGDENGFVLGDFGPGIDTTSLVKGSMSASAIAGCIDLPGKIVVSTACATGGPAFAKAFLDGGVATYIAPNGYPEGCDTPLFAHL